MRQLDTELRRFFARRLVRGIVLVTLLIAILSISIATVRGHPPRANGARVSVGQPVIIDQNGTPVTDLNGRQEFVYPQDLQPPDTRIDVGKSLRDTLQGMAVVMLFLCVVLGASFVGADFNVGSLTSQLLYEPRRWRVHLAKAATVAIACAAVAAFVCVFIGALMYGGSELHGIVRGITADWWRHRAVDLARAVVVAASAGVMSYSVTMVLHRTSAAIVAFMVQFPLVHIHKSVPVVGLIARCLPFRGLIAITSDPSTGTNLDLGIRTNAGGLAFVALWIVLLFVFSGLVFSRSEVR